MAGYPDTGSRNERDKRIVLIGEYLEEIPDTGGTGRVKSTEMDIKSL